jgi:hypothetical protein
VLGPAINRYNAQDVEIDRSLKRLEADKIMHGETETEIGRSYDVSQSTISRL